jgi:hypothetical protein
MARPIHTAPKNGKVIFVGDDHGTIAKAFWHRPKGFSVDQGMWAFATPEGAAHQIDFTPTRWGESTAEFERD